MWKKIVLGILVVISGVAGFGAAKVKSTMDNTLNHIKRDYDNQLVNVELPGNLKLETDRDIVNILLIGSDKRVEKESGFRSDGLTDTMMIATLDKKHGALKLTTLMRDTLVVDAETSEEEKLNSAYSHGGVKNLYKTIAQNFKIKVDGYAMVGLKGFQKVIDAVGGVELQITETEARYLNCTNYVNKKYHKIKPGKHTLNGNQALGYCRIRKGKDKIGEPVVTVNGLTDDYGRTWRQRTVLTSIFQKMKSQPKSKWIQVLNKAFGCVKTDLDNSAIYDYMISVITMGTTEIQQLQIPMDGYFCYGKQVSGVPESLRESIVPTAGGVGQRDPSVNSDILNKFIYKYDGKKKFTYSQPAGENS